MCTFPVASLSHFRGRVMLAPRRGWGLPAQLAGRVYVQLPLFLHYVFGRIHQGGPRDLEFSLTSHSIYLIYICLQIQFV